MAFDFAQADKQAKAALKNTALFALLVGPSGAGKSRLIGSIGGKVLMLYGSGEDHGPVSASMSDAPGLSLTPVALDFAPDGTALTPDQSYDYYLDIVSDAARIKAAQYTTVAVDGLPELEAIVGRTQRFNNMLINDKGKINSFLKSSSMTELLTNLLAPLKKIHALGINVLVTCRSEVRALDEDGSVTEASLRLSTYQVADDMAARFGDIVMVGSVTVGGKAGYALQFGGDITRVSKDVNGKVKKYSNFCPRLTGVREVPAMMKADLQRVLALKTGKETK